MPDFVSRAKELEREASELLHETGLITILEKVGIVHVRGSYLCGVMTRRDIDICLEVERVDILGVFDLGRETASLPDVGSMYFWNEFVLKTPGNPTAVFWCVEFAPPNAARWKVDVLVSAAAHVKPTVDYGTQLRNRLTERQRELVLGIKGVLSQLSEYRLEFRSSDIYAAVLDHGAERRVGSF